MSRFYFGLRAAGTLSPDDEGLEFRNVEEAYLEAFRAAREMWPELLIKRSDPRDFAFEISDQHGTLVMVVPFTEVLEACAAPVRPATAKGSQALWAKTESNVRRMMQQSRDLVAAVAAARDALETSRQLLAAADRVRLGPPPER